MICIKLPTIFFMLKSMIFRTSRKYVHWNGGIKVQHKQKVYKVAVGKGPCKFL